MNQQHVDALLAGLVPEMKSAIAAATAPLLERIARLEARAPEKGDKGDVGEAGRPGKDGEAGPAGDPGPPGAAGPAGAAGEKGEPGAKGEAGPAGRDGRDGQPGRDGEKGIDGKDGAPGLNGKDGIDGLGFDDIQVEFDGERSFKLVFIRGDQRKEFGAFILPTVIDRGVWKEGEFKRGDAVTWGGSLWIAQKDTAGKPDTPDSGWRLSAKKGRDGKDGKDGKPGERGLPGPKGDPGPRGFGV